MTTVLNVKLGSRVTVLLPDGTQADGEIVEFPKIARVKTGDGTLYDLTLDRILAEEPGKTTGASGRLSGTRLSGRL